MYRMVQSGVVQRDPPYSTSPSLDPVAIRPITPISPISPIYKTTSPSPHPSRGARRGSCFLAILLLLWDEVPASGEGVRIVLLDEDVALWVEDKGHIGLIVLPEALNPCIVDIARLGIHAEAVVICLHL